MAEHWFKSHPRLGIQIIEGHVIDIEEEDIPAGMMVNITYYVEDEQSRPHPDFSNQDTSWHGLNHADDFTFDDLPDRRTAMDSLLFFAKNFDGSDGTPVCISAGELKEIASQLRSVQK
jgi:hypothetical protein